MAGRGDGAAKEIITFDSELELFEQIKSMAATVQSEIPEGSDLFRYRNHFDEAFRFFEKLYSMNQSLLEKLQEQNAVLMSSAAKTATIVQVVRDDADTITKYKKEYEEVSNTLKTLQDSEDRSRELLRNLNETVAKLAEQVQRGEAFSYGDDNTFGSITQDVENLTKERDKGAQVIDEVASEIARHKSATDSDREAISRLSGSAAALEQRIAEYQAQLESIEADNETTRGELADLRPVVAESRKMNESNKGQAKELAGRIGQKKLANYDAAKQLSGATSAMKAMRTTLAHKEKNLDRLAERNDALNGNCDRFESAIAQTEHDRKALSDEGKEMDKEMEGTVYQLEKLNDELTALEKVRADERAIYKGKMDEALKMRREHVKQAHQMSRTARQIDATSKEHEKVKTALHVEKQETETMKRMRKDLTRTKKQQKRAMQNQKIILKNLEQGIQQQRTDTAKVHAKRMMTIDERRIVDAKNVDDNKWLRELQGKQLRQAALSEELRDERNISKRKYEQCQKEQHNLRNDVSDLAKESHELRQHLKDTEVDIAEKHLRLVALIQQNMDLENNVGRLQNILLTANHSIYGLMAEQQVLKTVLNEAASDKLRLAKEIDSTLQARSTIAGTLGKRNATIEELQGQALVLKMNIEKRRADYKEKCEEIAKLNKEATALIERNMQLQEMKERRDYESIQSQRFSEQLLHESVKNSALVHEINCPRNVHRWQMYGATDETYAKNIQYLSQMYAKLDEAHRELVALEQEKASLQEQLKAKRAALGPKVGESAFEELLETYRKNIAQKDKIIAEMRAQADGFRDQSSKMQVAADKLRGNVSTRRAATSHLRGRNLSSRNKQRQGMLFMTEPSEARVIGGGFVQKPATPTSDLDDLFGPSSSPQTNRRHYKRVPTPTSPNKSRTRRPQTALVIKRAPLITAIDL